MKEKRWLKWCLLFTLALFFAVPAVGTRQAQASTSIPSSAVKYNGHYYYVYTYQKSWDDAEAFCEERGGTLVTITSAGEQAFIEDLLEDYDDADYYIGLNTSIDSSLSTWVTGEAVNYTNWGGGQPSGGSQYAGAIANGERSGSDYSIDQGEWDDRESASLAFICEWGDSGIASGASYYNGHYYYVYEDAKSWDDAEAFCEIVGGTLVAITSSGEQSFIESLLAGYDDADYYIGIHYDLNNFGTWVTGETVSYTNWGTNEPDCNGGDQYAGVIANGERSGSGYSIDYGEWDDREDVELAFICEWDSATVADATVKLSKWSYTYSGSANKPSISVSIGTKKLTNGTDYKVTYSNNTDAGTATVKITGIGSYSGTKTIKVPIAKKSIKKLTVKLSTTTYTYSGSAKKPTVTVKYGSKTLTSGTDFKVTYASGRKNCGKYKVTIKGTGNYTGTVTKYFKIKPKKASSPTLTASGSKKVKVKWSKSSGSVTGYQIYYRVKGSSSWKKVTVKSTSKTLTGLKSGKTYQVKIRAYKTISGKKVYGSFSSVKTVKVK